MGNKQGTSKIVRELFPTGTVEDKLFDELLNALASGQYADVIFKLEDYKERIHNFKKDIKMEFIEDVLSFLNAGRDVEEVVRAFDKLITFNHTQLNCIDTIRKLKP